jgi:hypothetical protein
MKRDLQLDLALRLPLDDRVQRLPDGRIEVPRTLGALQRPDALRQWWGEGFAREIVGQIGLESVGSVTPDEMRHARH